MDRAGPAAGLSALAPFRRGGRPCPRGVCPDGVRREAEMVTTRKQIDDFWALKRLAVVGVSRDPKHFSSAI